MENNLSQNGFNGLTARAVRLASAVYRVTNFFSDGGVLKNQIREKAGEIVLEINAFWGSDRSEKKCYTIKIDMEGLKALFNIAQGQNWVKPINLEVLTRGYTNLERELEEIVVKTPKTSFLSENDKSSPKLRYNSENRQSQILGYLKNNGHVQIAQVCQFFPQVSRRTLIRDLDGLTKSGLIQRNGAGRGICYEFSRDNFQEVKLS